MKIKTLKELILDNYSVEIIQDRNRLWIPIMEDQSKNVCVEKIENNKIWISSGNKSYTCECDDSILYCLMEFIGDKHRWGSFKNEN